MKLKINWKNLKDTGLTIAKTIAVGGFTGLLGVAGLVSAVRDAQDAIAEIGYLKSNVTYADAIHSITNCSMFSSDKRELIKKLRTDRDSTFYKAVITVVTSEMFSHDRLTTVLMMQENK